MAKLAVGLDWSEVRGLHEWRLAAILGYDLEPTTGAPGSQLPGDVQRAITERTAMLRTLPAEVKAERQRKLDEVLAMRKDPALRKRRREELAAAGVTAGENDRILDAEVEILMRG